MNIRHGTYSKQAGFTLLELMIGQVIALILISGLLAFITPSVAAVSRAKSSSDLQDSGRLGFEYLQQAIFQAGYQGCRNTSGHTSVIAPSPSGASPRLRNWAYLQFGIRGYDANESERMTDSLGAPWRNAQYRYAENKIGDVVVVQTPEGPAMVLQRHNPDRFTLEFKGRINDRVQPGQIIQLNDCNHSARLQINPNTTILYTAATDTTTVSYAPEGSLNCGGVAISLISLGPEETAGCTGAATLEGEALFQFDVGTRGHIVSSEVYYVGYDTAAGAPALKRSGFANNASRVHTETLVEGVENLRLRYGVDTDDDNMPNHFVSAAEIAEQGAGNPDISWANVVNLKMWLLVRSSKKTQSNSQTSTLFFPTTSGTSVNCQSTVAEDAEEYESHILACPFSAANRKQYDRKTFIHTVSLGNTNL